MSEWVIEQVWKEKGEERTGRYQGWWYQGRNVKTGRTTCLYQKADDCLNACTTMYAEPWGV